MSNTRPIPAAAVRTAYHEELNDGQRSALLSWLSFTGTFALTRGVTYSIRAGWGPFRNLSAGGEHLHHYLWGIGMLAGVGAIAVRGEDRHRRHPAVAISYGAALALIVDEFALLLDLRDVYWARQGRISVDLGVGGSAVAGTYLAARPVLRRVARDQASARSAPAPSSAGPVARAGLELRDPVRQAQQAGQLQSEQAQQPPGSGHGRARVRRPAAQFPVGGDYQPPPAHRGGQLGDGVVTGAGRGDHPDPADLPEGGYRRLGLSLDDQDVLREPAVESGRPSSAGRAATPRPASAASSPYSRAAAPARSRHHPSAREPITLAPSTTTVTGSKAARMTGQVSANPGCRSSDSTRSAGTQVTSGASRLTG